MHKFFVESENITDNMAYIHGDDVNHISKVLRLKRGEEILISNGIGNEYLCSIDEIGKKEVKCVINKAFKNLTEATIKIVLYQGLPKSQKMDLIVQKCVEIGVVKIQPVITERVVVKPNDKSSINKIERWNRIAEEAAKQSNRGIIPKVLEPITFDEAVEELSLMDLAVVPYEKEIGSGLKSLLKDSNEIKNVGILIGPEGGFEESEIDICIKNKIHPVTLGPRILRTETAGFVASTIILYEAGDMGGQK